MSTRNLARDERGRLCDLALQLGPDAPTLCGDWTVEQLVAHLLVRERNPVGAVGIVVPLLSGLTDRAMTRAARAGFPAMVARLRSPGLSPVSIPQVDRLVNTMEYFVHHEDIRRAQPSCTPRLLSSFEQAQLWGGLKVTGKALVRPAGVPVSIRRSDQDTTAVLKAGDGPVTVAGLPSELTMFLYGRAEHQGLAYDGPAERIEALKRASLGL